MASPARAGSTVTSESGLESLAECRRAFRGCGCSPGAESSALISASVKFFGMGTGKVSSSGGIAVIAGEHPQGILNARGVSRRTGLPQPRQCSTAARANSSFK